MKNQQCCRKEAHGLSSQVSKFDEVGSHAKMCGFHERKSGKLLRVEH